MSKSNQIYRPHPYNVTVNLKTKCQCVKKDENVTLILKVEKSNKYNIDKKTVKCGNRATLSGRIYYHGNYLLNAIGSWLHGFYLCLSVEHKCKPYSQTSFYDVKQWCQESLSNETLEIYNCHTPV